MTEHQAQTWLEENFDVSREAWMQLESFIEFLRNEALSQNLVSASTLGSIWSRHIVDSVQLLKFLPHKLPDSKKWIDLGSGAGFPGIVIAILTDYPMTLVESRGRRIAYLKRAIAMLGLEERVSLAGMPLERLETTV